MDLTEKQQRQIEADEPVTMIEAQLSRGFAIPPRPLMAGDRIAVSHGRYGHVATVEANDGRVMSATCECGWRMAANPAGYRRIA